MYRARRESYKQDLAGIATDGVMVESDELYEAARGAVEQGADRIESDNVFAAVAHGLKGNWEGPVSVDDAWIVRQETVVDEGYGIDGGVTYRSDGEEAFHTDLDIAPETHPGYIWVSDGTVQKV